MNLKISVLSLLISISAFAEPGFYPISKDLPAHAKNVERATVAIMRLKPDGKAEATGTAFLVATTTEKEKVFGVFLTNAHVFDDKCEFKIGPCNFGIFHHYFIHASGLVIQSDADREAWKSYPQILLGYDETRDLAAFVAELPPQAAREPVTFDLNPIGNQRNVFTLASPMFKHSDFGRLKNSNGLPQQVWSKGKVFTYQAAELKIFPHTIRNLLIHDADTTPGSSGGPVFDQSGTVVGINTERGVVCLLYKDDKKSKNLKKANQKDHKPGCKEEVFVGVAVNAQDIQIFLRNFRISQ